MIRTPRPLYLALRGKVPSGSDAAGAVSVMSKCYVMRRGLSIAIIQLDTRVVVLARTRNAITMVAIAAIQRDESLGVELKLPPGEKLTKLTHWKLPP